MTQARAQDEAPGIWTSQCDAAVRTRERFGEEKALGYLIGEKLAMFLRHVDKDVLLDFLADRERRNVRDGTLRFYRGHPPGAPAGGWCAADTARIGAVSRGSGTHMRALLWVLALLACSCSSLRGSSGECVTVQLVAAPGRPVANATLVDPRVGEWQADGVGRIRMPARTAQGLSRTPAVRGAKGVVHDSVRHPEAGLTYVVFLRPRRWGGPVRAEFLPVMEVE